MALRAGFRASLRAPGRAAPTAFVLPLAVVCRELDLLQGLGLAVRWPLDVVEEVRWFPFVRAPLLALLEELFPQRVAGREEEAARFPAGRPSELRRTGLLGRRSFVCDPLRP